MTDEEINRVIAEICGWKIHPANRNLVTDPKYPHSVQPIGTIPDYCNDLNEMHEAEKVLTRGTVHEIINATNAYIKHLARILACIDTAFFQFTHATARQRAEAFLRAVGKWEERA